MKSLARNLLFLILFLCGIAGVAIYWTFYRPLPDYETTIADTKLQEPVQIHWDEQGVPHIYAKTKHDLYYSLGYAHAQDRLWQMTLNQMMVEGRFSEFLGKDMLSFDIMQRTIGIWKIAKKIEDNISDSTRAQLQAYADGVNFYIQEHPKSLPIQFALADMSPIKWTVTHSIAMARLIGWKLNLAWKSELTYAYLSDHLPAKKFSDLLPNNEFVKNDNLPKADSTWADALMPFVQSSLALDKLLGSEGSSRGSNAWAVSAKKSATDYPLLAGDPHLPLNIPGTWYEVHLNLNGRNLSGATMAGAPAVVIGQNEQLAWSVTNTMVDDTDFFLEAVNPNNEREYMLDSLAGEPVFQQFDYQKETIKIKNADDTVFTRKVTKHGPVISDVFPEQKFVKDRVISMRWTGQEVTNEVGALFTINWAQSFEEFRQGVREFKVPGQNFVYADKEGNIAQMTAANIPVRNSNPILLRKGWNPAHDWRGFIPFEELPSEINPDRGWVANANNPPSESDYPNYISIYWEPDSRYNRIRDFLQQDEVNTKERFQTMQNDTYSIYARDLTNLILPILKESDGYRFDIVISYLENWDYSYDPSETAASIMDVFMLRMAENTFRDEMTKEVYENFIRFPSMPIRSLRRILNNGSTFFDDIRTQEIETRNQIIVQSMNETVKYLEQNLGTEPFEWRWEQLHTITLKPPLFGQAASDSSAPAALKLIVDNLLSMGPYAAKGHNMSINNGEYDWNSPYEMVLGPSIRRIVDFSNMSHSLSILPTGQSGNPISEYYGSQTESWLQGQYKLLYQDSTFFDESQYKTMRLLPAQD